MPGEALPLLNMEPARPRRSRPRRISGANITGIASTRAGKVVRTSHENAGRAAVLFSRAPSTTNTSTPRSSTTAWVSRSKINSPKKINVTIARSSRLCVALGGSRTLYDANREVYGLLKRPDEKYVTERAYDNPKFVEDLVRDVAVARREVRRQGANLRAVLHFARVRRHRDRGRVDFRVDDSRAPWNAPCRISRAPWWKHGSYRKTLRKSRKPGNSWSIFIEDLHQPLHVGDTGSRGESFLCDVPGSIFSHSQSPTCKDYIPPQR